MFASLPMYDRPANRAAHDALWVLIRDALRDQGIAAPDNLDRGTHHMAGWGRTDLVLGQICNLPLRHIFWDDVTIIGASDYGLQGCPPGYYRSHLIIHRNTDAASLLQRRDMRFVCNERQSWSGYGAAQDWAMRHGGALENVAETGSHDASLAMVATGAADLAAIDAQTWHMQCADMRAAREVRIVAHTQATPGQTFITRRGMDPSAFFAAIHYAIDTLSDTDRRTLGLCSIVALPKQAYDRPKPPPWPRNEVNPASPHNEALPNPLNSGLVLRN